MKVSVLGCGRWGSFLAWYNNYIGHDVVSFGREDSPSYKVLKETGKNEWVTLSEGIQLSCDLKYSVERADVIIISINSQGLREFFKQIVKYEYKDKIFVLCMKGIENVTGKRLTEVAIESGIDKSKIAVWVGPGHIQEFTKGRPSCMVIDSYSDELTDRLISYFKSSLIRFYHGNDIIGTEIGAAAKNVMGILAGAADGMQMPALKGALMARGSREIARLIGALGGNELSAYGLCHLGDYEATLFSEHSHNRKWGELFVKGEKFTKLAEGVMTAKAISALAATVGAKVPLTDAVNKMIDGAAPDELLKDLFERPLTHEFE
ncbi:MAG: glycerol-3-phosphate dehydrogenase [Clostridiales bacterium]|nr:glycerol-3-phosphate dehydrogenase [Clostridiales bacterium]